MRHDRKGIMSARVNREFFRHQRRHLEKNESFYANQLLNHFSERTPNIIEVNEFLNTNSLDHEAVTEDLMSRVNPDREDRKRYAGLRNSGSIFANLFLIVLLISSLAQGVEAREGLQAVDLAQLDQKIDAMNAKILVPKDLHGVSVSDSRAKEFVDRRTKVPADLKKLFKDIARSSAESAHIIKACVENTNSFAVANLERDREFLLENEYIQRKSGGRAIYRGDVSEGKNGLVLVDRFNDVESTREAIIHECLHVWQSSQNIKYSKATQEELNECVIGLRELLDKIPSCFNGDDDSCDEVKKYSKNFRHQIVIDECPNLDLKVNGAYRLGKFSNSKISWKKLLLVSFDPIGGTDEGLCLKYAFGLEDKKTGKRILFSDEEKDLAQMAVILNSIRDEEQTAKLYKNNTGSQAIYKELHPNIFDKVPHKMLGEICKPELVGRLQEEADKNKSERGNKGGGGRNDL